MTNNVNLERQTTPRNAFVETASGLLKLAALAGFVTTAFGFPAVMYRLNAIHVPLAFLSSADALTAGLIPTAFLGLVYLGLLGILQIAKADTPDQTVSAVLVGTGSLLGMLVLLIPLLFVWVIAMLFVGAASPLLHIFHLSYLVYRHEIPQSEVLAAYKQLSIWPPAILFLIFVAASALARYSPQMRWIESLKRWFSKDRMARHLSVCVLLAIAIGVTVMAFTAVALWVITAVAVREFQMDLLSALSCLLISLTVGVIAFCTVLVFGPGSQVGLQNLKPASVALYLMIVVWYSVRVYPEIPQWLGGGQPTPVVLWLSAEDAPEFLTKDRTGWEATEERGLVRIRANMLYATADAVVLVGRRAPETGIVISRDSIRTLIGG